MFKFIHLYRTLLVLVILASIVAIITNGTALLQGPMSGGEANAAEWMSAISTFWGAVAAGLGAAVTGGALLVAALTYQRQVADIHAELESKRREQAEAVTVEIAPYEPAARNFGEDRGDKLSIAIRNDSKLAIFGIALVVVDKNRKEPDQRLYDSIAPGRYKHFVQPKERVGGAYAMFTDTAGVRWKRWHNGELMEIPHYLKPDE
ncbi:hypothetical protein [Pseudarthrobacter oxydans]|uniref:hypothetical protein n=1 Tax=Pseudarthrobacter oxydans TaxID=1671 RepID=UPI0035E643BD|nr:hypothetical protein GCM10017547_38480 [Pseudarthrobacter oxydans]